jgi:hypothetical protein
MIMLYDFINTHKEGIKDAIFSATYLIASVFLLIVALFSKQFRLTFQKHINLLLFECFLISGGIIYYWSKALLFITLAHTVLAGAIVLFWIYLVQRKGGEKVVVSAKEIFVPALFGNRKIQWPELTNVVKKDDLLTFDFKNNKIIQIEISKMEGDEIEFNRFCQRQLAAQN